MSSDLQSTVYFLILNNCLSLMGCTIVGYDYILTFPGEVEYIWRRRWTWVSGVFILVRYPGLCWALLNTGLIGTTFITGPVQVHVSTSLRAQHQNVYEYSAGNILFLVSCWAFPVFICAADLVMILRVYTIWGRSRTLLYALMFIFVGQVIVSVVLPAIYNSNINYFTPSIEQILDFSLCNGTFSPSVPVLLGLYAAIPRFLLSASLLVLVTAQTLRQMVQMFNATKQWQPNRYIHIFARDGTYYFLINTIYNIVTVIGSISPVTANFNIIALDVLGVLAVALICSAMPRFIISVREMYDRDVRGRLEGIDTGFGVFSQNTPDDPSFLQSGIAFADHGSRTLQGEGEGDEPSAIPLEAVGEDAYPNSV